MGKLPYFPFFTGDWKIDIKLQSCSIAARGLWIEMICIMHGSEKYGYYMVNGKAISDEEGASLVGINLNEYKQLLNELKTKKIPKEKNNILYSKRMVNDDKLRKVRRKCGKLGKEFGKLGGRPKKPQTEPQTEPQNNPLSSSSSSSSSDKEKNINNSKAEFFKCDYFVVNMRDKEKFCSSYGIAEDTFLAELKRMDSWLYTHPNKRKKDYPKFVNNWLGNMGKKQSEKDSGDDREYQEWLQEDVK